MDNQNQPFGFNLRSPGTDPSDDVAAQQDFEYYQAQLRRMLEEIKGNGKQFELSEDVGRLKFYLKIMEDRVFLRKCGAALIRSFIAHIHDVDRKLSNILPGRIPENSAFDVTTVPLRATENHAQNSQEREPSHSLEPFRISESFNPNQFFERRQPQPGPSRLTTNRQSNSTATGHWFFGPSQQDSRGRQPVPQSVQRLCVPTSMNVTGQAETSFNWQRNVDMDEVTVLFERLGPVPPSGSNIEVPSIWNRDSAPRENRNFYLNTTQTELSHAHTGAYQSGPSSVNRGHWNYGLREPNYPSQLPQNQPNSQPPIQFIFLGPTYFPAQAQQPTVPSQPQRASVSSRNRGVERVLRDPRRSMSTHQSDNHARSHYLNPRVGDRYRNTSPYHSYSRGGRRFERRRH